MPVAAQVKFALQENVSQLNVKPIQTAKTTRSAKTTSAPPAPATKNVGRMESVQVVRVSKHLAKTTQTAIAHGATMDSVPTAQKAANVVLDTPA
tara:strand:- start:2406 stop:2687 length:282 start_codon:yes stop_codon:yes gene_type:complete